MDYLELNCNMYPFSKWATDIFSSMLADAGYESFVDTETGTLAYIPKVYFNAEILKDIANNDIFNGISIQFKKKVIKQQNWNAVWESNFAPVIVNDKCIIKAPFHDVKKTYPYEILIEPKMSFGTGHHETTSLIIENILELDFTGKTVLDMGCGTAILAILASMRNAKHITAIDNDLWAYNNSIENIKKNNINNIEVHHGDAKLIKGKYYDIILANINRNILLEDIKKYAACMETGAILILSGIYTTDMNIIKSECNKYRLKFNSLREKNKWAAASFVMS